MPYLPGSLHSTTAVPPYISGRTSYLRVRLEFLPYPQVIPLFCNTGGFGPRRGLTHASPCPWIAHPVSGLIPATPRALFRLAFAPAPRLYRRLTAPAAETNSPDHSTKGTPSGLPPGRPKGEHSLRLLVGAGVQGLFHPPLGVLFTFPSRYSCTIGGQVVFSLGGWSPRLPTGFRVSRGTQGPQSQRARPSPTGLSPAPARRSRPLRLSTRSALVDDQGPTTPRAGEPARGLGSSRFARHYSGNLTLISLPRGTEMFQFPRFPAGIAYAFSAG